MRNDGVAVGGREQRHQLGFVEHPLARLEDCGLARAEWAAGASAEGAGRDGLERNANGLGLQLLGGRVLASCAGDVAAARPEEIRAQPSQRGLGGRRLVPPRRGGLCVRREVASMEPSVGVQRLALAEGRFRHEHRTIARGPELAQQHQSCREAGQRHAGHNKRQG